MLATMRCAAVGLIAMLLVGCNQQKPKLSDSQIRQFRTLYPGMTDSCLDKLKWGGAEAMPHRSDQCYKFGKPRRWKGVWVNAFEGSQFCQSLSSCPAKSDAEIWLEFATKPRFQDKLGQGGVYEVEFIGRRSVGAGKFGHFGVFPNDIIVDRMISMKEVQAPPKN